MAKSGNGLVTELLLKSAYHDPFRKEYFYANHSVFLLIISLFTPTSIFLHFQGLVAL